MSGGHVDEGEVGHPRRMRTTIWRPNVRVTLNEYGEVEDAESGERR